MTYADLKLQHPQFAQHVFKEDPTEYTNQEMVNFHNEILDIKKQVQKDFEEKQKVNEKLKNLDQIKAQRKILRETEMRYLEQAKTIKRKPWTKEFAVILYEGGHFPYEYLSKKWSHYIFWLDNPNHDYKLADYVDKTPTK